jgi:Flp pilus assembly protein TadG
MRTRMKMLTGMRTKMLEGMKTTLRLPSFLPRIARLRGDDRGAQLVEFAVALPLLVLFVVGIFDFSNAFTFKQKLTNVTRDTARLAAADPANDLQFPSTAAPASVIDAFEDVDKYLVANNINDCGLSTAAASNTPGSLIWTYTVSTNCPGTLTVIINRGYYFSPNLATQPANVNCQPPALSGGPTQTVLIGTCVSIQYPYQWRFGGIASILGRSQSLPPVITAAAVSLNEN